MIILKSQKQGFTPTKFMIVSSDKGNYLTFWGEQIMEYVEQKYNHYKSNHCKKC